MPNHTNHLEQHLWVAADELRANSKLRAADYSLPVLGLIFLKYADFKFERLTALRQPRPLRASRNPHATLAQWIA